MLIVFSHTKKKLYKFALKSRKCWVTMTKMESCQEFWEEKRKDQDYCVWERRARERTKSESEWLKDMLKITWIDAWAQVSLAPDKHNRIGLFHTQTFLLGLKSHKSKCLCTESVIKPIHSRELLHSPSCTEENMKNLYDTHPFRSVTRSKDFPFFMSTSPDKEERAALNSRMNVCEPHQSKAKKVPK